MERSFVHWITPVAGLALMISVFLLLPPLEGSSNWIPLLGNSIESPNPVVGWSILGISLAATLFGLYCIVLKSASLSFLPTLFIYLLLLFADPLSISFNILHIVVALIVWSQFCLFENQLFTAFLLASSATLLYPPVFWIIAVSLIISLFSGEPDHLRNLIKMFSAILLPLVYILIFRWIKYDDALVFLSCFKDEVIATGSPLHLFDMTHYFLFAVMGYMVVRSIVLIVQKSPSGVLSYILKTEIVVLLLGVALTMLFYTTESLPLHLLTLAPLTLLFSYYYKNCEKRSRVNLEFLFLILAMALNSISYIFN